MRVGRRRHADEQRTVGLVRVAPARGLARGAALARHVVARHAGADHALRVFHHGLQHRPDAPCDLRVHRLAHLVLRVVAEQAERHQLAVVGEHRVGLGQLGGVHRQAVAERHAGGGDVRPFLVERQVARVLAGEAQRQRRAETDPAELFEDRLGSDLQGDLAHADVRGVDQYPGHGQYVAPGDVVDGVPVDGHPARCHADLTVLVELAGGQRRRHAERLDHRARLEGIGEGAVAHEGRGEAGAVVRVVGGEVGHRQDLPALRVHQDRRAGVRAELEHGLFQRLVGDEL